MVESEDVRHLVLKVHKAFLHDGARYEETTGVPSTSTVVRGITLRLSPEPELSWTGSEA